MSQSKTNLYFTTMIFTIVSGLICLGLLVLLIYGPETTRQYSPLIITIQVGLLLNIIIAVLRIMYIENKLDDVTKNSRDNLLSVKECPDYWTLGGNTNGRRVCNRTYSVRTDDSQTVEYKLGRVDEVEQINLDDFDRKPMYEVCGNVSGKSFPWTDVRAVCNAYKYW